MVPCSLVRYLGARDKTSRFIEGLFLEFRGSMFAIYNDVSHHPAPQPPAPSSIQLQRPRTEPAQRPPGGRDLLRRLWAGWPPGGPCAVSSASDPSDMLSAPFILSSQRSTAAEPRASRIRIRDLQGRSGQPWLEDSWFQTSVAVTRARASLAPGVWAPLCQACLPLGSKQPESTWDAPGPSGEAPEVMSIR